jgi:hypothetical protein
VYAALIPLAGRASVIDQSAPDPAASELITIAASPLMFIALAVSDASALSALFLTARLPELFFSRTPVNPILRKLEVVPNKSVKNPIRLTP